MSFFIIQKNFKKSLEAMDSPHPLIRLFSSFFVVATVQTMLGITAVGPLEAHVMALLVAALVIWLPGELLAFNAKLEKYVNATYALLGLPVLVHVHYMLLTILFAPDIASLANFVLTVILFAGIALAIWGEE